MGPAHAAAADLTTVVPAIRLPGADEVGQAVANSAPVCRPDRYDDILVELRARHELSLDTRRRLAAETFAMTAAYEEAIANWFSAADVFPDALLPGFEKELELAYGENPHQRAAYYSERGARRHLLSRVDQLHGRDLSFNNLNDLSAARLVAREFELPACVIVKHANPCGVAVAGSIEQAYERALASDPLSAYGGVIVLNRPVSEALGERLAEQFVEVLFAPGYDEAALERLRDKPATRILHDRERRLDNPGERDYKRVLGGLLVQERDWDIEDREAFEVVCGSPSEMAWGDLLFAWRVCKHVTSNAIVLAHDLQTIGVGAGQMSRVDSVRIALDKAREHGHETAGGGARLRRVLPVRRRPAARAGGGRDRDHPAGRLEARRRGDRGRRACGRDDGLHKAPPLPALTLGSQPGGGVWL